MPLPKQKLTFSEPIPIFAYDSSQEKPSTQRHDLDDLVPGVDEAESDSLSPQQLKFLCDKLGPKDFTAYIKLLADGSDEPDAEDAEQRLTPPAAAMDARLRNDATGAKTFSARWPAAARIRAGLL